MSTVLLAGTSGADYQWIRELFSLGGSKYAGASVMHPYTQPNLPERSLAQVISEEGKVEEEFSFDTWEENSRKLIILIEEFAD